MKNFGKNSKILSDKDAQTFTEQFIKDQMKTSWGINKQNQLLFVWDAVYGQILTNKQLYTGEDGNQTRLDEFEKVMEKAEACGKKYNEGFKTYMRQKSAEARQQSAEARQQSAEARKENIQLTQIGIDKLIEFYNLYKKDPSSVKPEFINQSIQNSKKIIQNCKQYNIDYKSKLSPEVRKFYGIE